ncbi:hypothetical protein PGB90_010420 [Kerria lacca]
MPYGISNLRYFTLIIIGLLSGAAGSQVVHIIYKPLEDLPDLIDAEITKLRISEEIPEESSMNRIKKLLEKFDNLHKQFEKYEKRK